MTLGPVVLILTALALLVGAVIKRRGGRAPVPSAPAASGPHHLHYCTVCDRQWEHGGRSSDCIRYWATACPACARA